MKRNVLVTGAAKGIGAAIAGIFAEHGDNVMINYFSSEAEALRLKRRLSAFARVGIYRADVSVKAQADEMLAAFLREFGRPDVVVNNAGIASYGLITDLSEAEWDRLFAVNVKGAHLVTQAALPAMISAKSGKIVNVSSMWGKVGASCEVAYSATKAALIGYTKALAKEVGPSNINVNCVCPGVVLTDMTKNFSQETLSELADGCALCRNGLPRDVAEAVFYLCSDGAAFITGQALSVDGGFVSS